jgi:hypothetical protein
MALTLARDISDDDRHAAWVQVADRIFWEQIRQGRRHRIFKLVCAVFHTNPELLAEGFDVFSWLVENYVDASLMLVRRELDKQAGTENLRNLLDDIIEHPEVLTRSRHTAAWPVAESGRASEVFDSWKPLKVTGSPERDHIDPQVIRSDLEGVCAAAEQIRLYAERTRAHRTVVDGIGTPIPFKELHRAIADICRTVEKYYELLTGVSVVQWEPVPQFDTMAVFMKPWVVDRKAVAAAMKVYSQEK